MTNIIVALVILCILALSIVKIISDKRKGMKCTGCSLSGECSSKKSAKKTKSEQLKMVIPIKELIK
ncbi:MAG: FeoB-associated Cys-rich membrane protein [Psychromonas sp.]